MGVEGSPRGPSRSQTCDCRRGENCVIPLEQGINLTTEANNLFLDAVEDNLLAAYGRLEGLARGDYGPDPAVDQFPEYVSSSLHQSIGCWKLFEARVAAVQPSSSTVARWTTVFKRLTCRRFTGASIITAEAAKQWMNGLINGKRTAHTIATVWRTALKTVFAGGVLARIDQSQSLQRGKN